MQVESQPTSKIEQSSDREVLNNAPAADLNFASLQGLPRPQVRQPLTKSRRLFFTSAIWTIFSLLLVVLSMSYYIHVSQRYAYLMSESQAAVEAASNDATKNELTTNANLKPPDVRITLAIGGLGLLGILVGLFKLTNAFVNLNVLNKLEHEGLETIAIVFDKWLDRASDSYSTFSVAFAYEIPTPRGTRRILRTEANPKAHHALKLGDQTRVKYLPNDPESCLLVDYR